MNKVNRDDWPSMLENLEHMVRKGLVSVTDGLMRDAIEKRFENFDFAVDENGKPDGLKNHQEMLLTISDDIANTLSEIAYENAQEALEKDDFLNAYAMQLLEDHKGGK